MTAFQAMIGAALGAILGLIPLFAGVRRSNQGLGIAGFFACMICGGILGIILAGPIAGVFYWLIVRGDAIPEGEKKSRKWIVAALVFGCLLLGALGVGVMVGMSRKSFLQSYKANFVASCVASDTSDAKRAFCDCTADGAVTKLTIKQLGDQAYSADYIKNNIIPSCAEKSRVAEAKP